MTNARGKNHYNYGKNLSQKTKNKISKTKKGRSVHSEAFKKKLRDKWVGAGNPMYGLRREKSPLYGKPRSEETKRKISEARTGKGLGQVPWNIGLKLPPLSDEHKRKISEGLKGRESWNKGLTKDIDPRVLLASEHLKGRTPWNKGKKMPDELKKRLSEVHKGLRAGSKHHFYGKQRSDETKRKLSESAKEQWKDPKFVEWRSKLMKAKWRDPEYQNKQRKARNMRPNGLERQFMAKNPEYQYVGDMSFFVGSKNPDFILPNTNICVDLFGDYWHKGENEEERKQYFTEHGYELKIIWEHDLNVSYR